MTRRDHAGVFVPPPLVYATPLIVAMWLNGRWPWLIGTTGSIALPVGAFLFLAAGIALGLAGVITFRQAKTTILPAGRPTTTIVESGPYAFTRNPMYCAMALGYIGLSLLLNNLWALSLLPAVLLVVDVFVIRREERYLRTKFGEDYRAYCARVRRWF